MDVVSLNTMGVCVLRPRAVPRDAGDNAPATYDSKIDKFGGRMERVQRQVTRTLSDITVDEVRETSLYEFWYVGPRSALVCSATSTAITRGVLLLLIGA